MKFGAKQDDKDLHDIRGTVSNLEFKGKGKVSIATITLDGNWGKVTLPAKAFTLGQVVIVKIVSEE